MPTGNFFQTLARLVREGGSQGSIIARFRGAGFGGRAQRLRALINRLRGRSLTPSQQSELTKFSLGLNVSLSPIPTAIEISARIRASYRVVRDQFNRRGEVLLSGNVEEVQTFVIPLQANEQQVENQALARLEEEISRRVAAAGLAQAGNYITPDITSQPVEIISTRFTDFV